MMSPWKSALLCGSAALAFSAAAIAQTVPPPAGTAPPPAMGQAPFYDPQQQLPAYRGQVQQLTLTSRGVSHCGDRTGGPVRRGGRSFYNRIARMQWHPEPMHGAHVAAATHVLFDKSKIVSRDLHRQSDSQIG